MKVKAHIHRFYLNFIFFGGIISGTIFSVFSKSTNLKSIVWLILAIILFLFSWIFARKFCLILALIAGVLLSLWRGSIYNFENLKIAQNIKKDGIIQAIVLEDPDLKEDGNLRIRSKIIGISDKQFSGKAFINLKTNQKVRRSDELLVKGKISEGFGDFAISIHRGILIKISPKSDFIRDIRDSFAGGVRKFIPSPEVDLGLGYLLGQKNSLPEEISKALTITALTHIVVASGYNLTVIVVAVQRIFNKISRKIALFVAILLVLGFVFVVGFTPSMIRAGIVAVFGLILWYFGRKTHAYFLLTFVAAITLIFEPSNLLNLGWQLSFTSFFGVLILSPLLQKIFFEKPEKLNSALKLFFETFSAQITTLPLIIFTFGAVSVISIFANMLVLPFVPGAMLATFLTGIFAIFSPIAHFFGFLAELILKYSIFIIGEFSKIKGAQLEISFSFSEMLICYFCLILVVILLNFKLRKDKIIDILNES